MEPVPSRYAPKEAHAKYMKLQCTSAAISSKRVEIDDTENEFASAAQVGKAGVRGFEAHAEWWFTGVKREDAQRKRRAAWGANPDEVANPDVPEDLLAAIKATSKVRREQREMQLDPQSSVASADARFGSRSMTVSEAGAVPANADGDVPLVLPSNEQDMMRTWGSAPPAVAGSDPANAEAGAGSAAVAQRSVAGDQGRPPSVAGSVSTPGRSEAGSKPSPSPVVDSSTTKRRKKVVSAEDKWSPLDDYNRTCRLSDDPKDLPEWCKPTPLARAMAIDSTRRGSPAARLLGRWQDRPPKSQPGPLGRAADKGLSTTKSSPAFTIGVKLATPRTRARNLGYPDDPGTTTAVPSFAADAAREGKGAPMLGKLKTWKEIERSLGIPEPPAPGGNIALSGFAEEGLRNKKGARLLGRPPTWKEIERKLEEGKRNNKGAKILGRTPIRHPGEGGLGPGGSSAMPSFALENIRAGKGVVFGHKLKTRFEIDEALGHFAGPAPGGNTKVPSFVRENLEQNKGVRLGIRPETPRTIARHLGYPTGPAPGDVDLRDGLAEKSKREKRGALLLSKVKTWEEIEERLGHPKGMGPGGTCRVPSFVHDNVIANKGPKILGRLPTWKEIERRIGIPEPPAPGGNCRVEGMAHDGRVQNRGVKFGSRIKSPRTIARNLGYPDDPGTTTEVPSFALENLRQNKGVKLGARVWPNEKIETSEGSTTAVPSFAEENKRAGKGVKFGIRPKTPRTIAENLGYPQMPGPDYYFRSDMPR